jgi:hypothetical protein
LVAISAEAVCPLLLLLTDGAHDAVQPTSDRFSLALDDDCSDHEDEEPTEAPEEEESGGMGLIVVVVVGAEYLRSKSDAPRR